jgi:PRC-barrel domain
MIVTRAGPGRTLPALVLLLAGLCPGPACMGLALAAGTAASSPAAGPSATALAQAPSNLNAPKPPAEQQQRVPTKPAQPPATPKPPPDYAKELPARQVMTLLGSKAQDLAGEDMGPVVDIVVDRAGRPRALVIDFGGFLGVGSRKIAIDWRLVHFRPENHDAPVLLHLDRAEVQAAPEFVPDVEPLRMLGPPPNAPGPPYVGR